MPGAAGKGRRLNEGAQPMKPNAIVSREEWLAARKRLLSKEKEFTRLRDDLSRERRELPWIEVEKKLRLRYPRRQAGFVRSLPGPRPARRLSLHVRSGLGAGVQELLVLGRQFQRHHRPSQSPGREPGCGFQGASGEARSLPQADGLDFQMGILFWERVQQRLPRFLYTRGAVEGRGLLQLWPDEVSQRRSPRDQRVLQGRRRPDIPHLFLLRPGPGHDERGVSLPRSGAQGA